MSPMQDPTIFKTRSPERDNESDVKRLRPVSRALDRAIAQNAKETDGLNRRLSDTYLSVVARLDDSGGYDERTPRDEREIKKSEAQIAAARLRLEALARESTRLRDMRETLRSFGV